MKRLVLELDNEEHQRIKEKALKQGESMRRVLLRLVRKWLNK